MVKNNKYTLVRITTIPGSLKGLLKGQLNYMSQYFNVIGISSPGETLDEVKRFEGIKVYAVPIKRKPSPIADLVSVYRIYSILKKEKPTIVHTHTPKAGFVGMIAAYLANVPLKLHTVAGLPLMTRKGLIKKVLIWIEMITYRFADMIYPNSYGLKDYINSLNIVDPNKIEVIAHGSSNGIDLSFFDPDCISDENVIEIKEKHNISNDDFIFIYIGRIVKDKGINELLYATKRLIEKYPEVKLLMLGNFEDQLDPIDTKLKQYAYESDNILLVGYQSDIRPYLKLADVMVHPSYREGFPNVVLQAGAFNLPCIVTDINGSNEIIINNYNGIIIPVGDTESLYEAMNKLLQTLEFKQINTRELISEKYERIFVWRKIFREYMNRLSLKLGKQNSL